MLTEDSLTEALEDYLEAIYQIHLTSAGIKVKRIASALRVSNPSVTSALKNLKKRGLIDYQPYGDISLTFEGLEVSRRIHQKHRLFKYFFHNILDIDQETSDAVACRMEHIIPKEVCLRLLRFIRYMEDTDSHGHDIAAGFCEYLEKDSLEASPTTELLADVEAL